MAVQERRDRGGGTDSGRGQVVRAQDRGATAFTAIYREHHRACLRVARRVVQDEGMAHDVVQDVFLTWWRTDGGGYCADRGELATWLSTLTHHKAVDAVRAAERGRRLLGASAADVLQQEELPDEVVWWQMGRQALVAALPLLSAKHREVLSLAYGGGLTQVEIAEQLGIPLGTVKSRTHAGLLRLRAAMSGTWTPTGPSPEPWDRPDVASVPALHGASWVLPADPAAQAVDGCAAELSRIAAASGADLGAAAIVERTQVLVAEHGEAALYALVVALTRAAACAPGAAADVGRDGEALRAQR